MFIGDDAFAPSAVWDKRDQGYYGFFWNVRVDVTVMVEVMAAAEMRMADVVVDLVVVMVVALAVMMMRILTGVVVVLMTVVVVMGVMGIDDGDDGGGTIESNNNSSYASVPLWMICHICVTHMCNPECCSYCFSRTMMMQAMLNNSKDTSGEALPPTTAVRPVDSSSSSKR